MRVQQQISRARLARKVGTVQRVLVDEIEPGMALARSSADAPEIDGRVRVVLPRETATAPVRPGQFLQVRVTGSDEYDLSAIPLDDRQ